MASAMDRQRRTPTDGGGGGRRSASARRPGAAAGGTAAGGHGARVASARRGVLGQFARSQQASSVQNLQTEAQDWLMLVNRLKNALDKESSEMHTMERFLKGADVGGGGSAPHSAAVRELPTAERVAHTPLQTSPAAKSGAGSLRSPSSKSSPGSPGAGARVRAPELVAGMGWDDLQSALLEPRSPYGQNQVAQAHSWVRPSQQRTASARRALLLTDRPARPHSSAGRPLMRAAAAAAGSGGGASRGGPNQSARPSASQHSSASSQRAPAPSASWLPTPGPHAAALQPRSEPEPTPTRAGGVSRLTASKLHSHATSQLCASVPNTDGMYEAARNGAAEAAAVAALPRRSTAGCDIVVAEAPRRLSRDERISESSAGDTSESSDAAPPLSRESSRLEADDVPPTPGALRSISARARGAPPNVGVARGGGGGAAVDAGAPPLIAVPLALVGNGAPPPAAHRPPAASEDASAQSRPAPVALGGPVAVVAPPVLLRPSSTPDSHQPHKAQSSPGGGEGDWGDSRGGGWRAGASGGGDGCSPVPVDEDGNEDEDAMFLLEALNADPTNRPSDILMQTILRPGTAPMRRLQPPSGHKGAGSAQSAANVYSSGARGLLQLRRASSARRTPTPATAHAPSVRASIAQQAARNEQLLQEQELKKRKEQERREAYLESQGLNNVKAKVFDIPPKAARAPVVDEAPTKVVDAEVPGVQMAVKPTPRGPRPTSPTREQRVAANRAIRRKNQELIDEMLKGRAWAMEKLKEEEEQRQAKLEKLRSHTLDTLKMHRAERERWEERVATYVPAAAAAAAASDDASDGAVPIAEGGPAPLHQALVVPVHDSMEAWRRYHQVPEGVGVLQWKGAYGVSVRARLLQRGWAENALPESPFFTLQWTLRGQDICYGALGENVLVNHFQGAEICTTKDGLNTIIRNMQRQAARSVPEAGVLCPRSYDPSITAELHEFLEDFHWSAAEALLRLLVVAGHATPDGLPPAPEAEGDPPPPSDAPTPGQVILYQVMDPTVIRWAVFACQRRLRVAAGVQGSGGQEQPSPIDPDLLVWLGQKGVQKSQSLLLAATPAHLHPGADADGGRGDEDDDLDGQELTRQQWDTVLKVHEEAMEFVASRGWRHHVPTNRWLPGSDAAKQAAKKRVPAQLTFLLRAARATLDALDAEWPEGAVLNGPTCAWMVKPAQAARGEGVKSMAGLHRILEECMHGPHRVLQKYMEAPFLVLGRKVDIRQWVLVTSVEPLQVYFFDECLIRFAGAPWNLHPEEICEARLHLCNHSLQCQLEGYNTGEGMEGDQNMWGSARMAEYLATETPWGAQAWEERVVPAMKRMTLQLMEAAAATFVPRAGCFELFGLDFMLDAHLNTWLLEVNESPDLRFTTPAKQAACARMLDGLTAVIVDHNGAGLLDPTAAGCTEPPATVPGGVGAAPVNVGGWERLTPQPSAPAAVRPATARKARPASSRTTLRLASGAARPRSAVFTRDHDQATGVSRGAKGLALNGQRILSAVRSGAA